MVTKKQILNAEGDELSILLGEVLQPEVKHHVHNGASHSCRNCKKELYTYSGRGTEALHQDCDIATPIPLDWPNAMKWRDWCVEEYGDNKFAQAFLSLFTPEQQCDVINWLAVFYLTTVHTQPIHYLKAVAICVIEGGK